jgi:hypothetical protein
MQAPAGIFRVEVTTSHVKIPESVTVASDNPMAWWVNGGQQE